MSVISIWPSLDSVTVSIFVFYLIWQSGTIVRRAGLSSPLYWWPPKWYKEIHYSRVLVLYKHQQHLCKRIRNQFCRSGWVAPKLHRSLCSTSLLMLFPLLSGCWIWSMDVFMVYPEQQPWINFRQNWEWNARFAICLLLRLQLEEPREDLGFSWNSL